MDGGLCALRTVLRCHNQLSPTMWQCQCWTSNLVVCWSAVLEWLVLLTQDLRPGTQFTRENLLTQAECESVGYCSPSGHDTYKVHHLFAAVQALLMLLGRLSAHLLLRRLPHVLHTRVVRGVRAVQQSSGLLQRLQWRRQLSQRCDLDTWGLFLRQLERVSVCGGERHMGHKTVPRPRQLLRSRQCVRGNSAIARILAYRRCDVQERDWVHWVQRAVAVSLSIPRGTYTNWFNFFSPPFFRAVGDLHNSRRIRGRREISLQLTRGLKFWTQICSTPCTDVPQLDATPISSRRTFTAATASWSRRWRLSRAIAVKIGKQMKRVLRASRSQSCPSFKRATTCPQCSMSDWGMSLSM